MSEVDSYVFVQFSRFFYGGRASLVPGFPGGSDSKASACNMGVLGSIPVSGRSPGEGNGHPLQYSCLEDPMQRRLVGYSPWGCKELDTTEWLHFLVWFQWLFHGQKQKSSCSNFRGWLWLLSLTPADFCPLCPCWYFLIGSRPQVQGTLLKPHPSSPFHSIWFYWSPSASWNPLFLWLLWDSELLLFLFLPSHFSSHAHLNAYALPHLTASPSKQRYKMFIFVYQA